MARRPVRSYHVTVVFRAPLPFAFAWCTDSSEDDPKYAGEDRSIHLQRRVIDRTARRVVFENLYDEGRGWARERHVVTLRPPDRWHGDGHGSYFDMNLDYRLTVLAGDRTRFTMEWSASPNALFRGRRASRRAVEGRVRHLGGRRARAMEREYRSTLPRTPPKRSGGLGTMNQVTPQRAPSRAASRSASAR
jgi:hypothetical protein